MAIDVRYRTDGPADGPAVVLAGSLGSSLDMWEPQIADLAGAGFRVVRYDHRGHGGSPVPESGTGTATAIADLAGDALRLLDRLGLERVRFAGLSLGGMVGMWLGAHAPERIERLALLCTAARLGTPESWGERAAAVRAGGSGAVAEAVVGRWFTPDYAAAHPEVPERMRAMVAATPAAGYAACCDAIGSMDLTGDLERISAPTLAIAGPDDPSTPPSHLEAIAAAVPGARASILPGGAHLASWERPDAVNALLVEHFS